MQKLDRRDFLKTSGLLGLGILGPGNCWALTKLEMIGDNLREEYPYRGWEALYRGEYTGTVGGYAAHCVNCQGNCAFEIRVQDGIVLREEQIARYPQVVPDIPDANPRGCQKGAVHSTSMYESDRLRYPMKRVGARGEGRWQRLSWEQAATEIADKIIDIYEAFGPGNLMSHVGTGVSSNGKLAAGYRFASLLGGILEDGMTNVGDLNTGVHLAYGDPLQGWTTDGWFEADYIMMTMINPAVTRMPDAHFLTEARYRGARIVSVVPDYNPSAIHSDLWINIRPGTDPYFCMAIVHTLLEENLWDRAFVKEQTDLPLLVREDNGKLLRQSDLQPGGKDDIFYLWDQTSDSLREAPGSMGSERKTIALGDIDPALEGRYVANEIVVRPAFERMHEEAMRYSPEATQQVTGVHPEIVRQEARLIARSKHLCLLQGFAVGKLLNGIYIGWSQALIAALTGHGGPNGGVDSCWVDDGWPATFRLAFLEMTKMPRFEPGGLASFLRGGAMTEAKKHFDDEKLRQRTGFGLADLEAMIDESVSSGQMPYGGPVRGAILIADNHFNRNKGPHYRERMLQSADQLLVVVNTRMDSTAKWADYLLPAASHYESWDLRKTAQHRFVNFFTAPVRPIGEARPDWNILELLTRKIQERARARGIGAYQDGDVLRDFKTIHDEFTLGGQLLTDKDEVRWMVENSPELGEQTFEQGVEQGFLTVWESQWPTSTYVTRGQTIKPWKKQVIDKEPYPTLSGRITFYCDHDWFQKLKSTVPTARLNAGRGASRYPLSFYTPHTRWGIHTNWRANKYMQRLQRGLPYVCISPALAKRKGIADGDPVRVFNSIGEFQATAKLLNGVRDDQVLMEHAWENYQFPGQKGLNDVVATLLQPLELVGNWGHLKFSLFRWNPNQLAHESGVDIAAARDI